jgi:hypothetical protein
MDTTMAREMAREKDPVTDVEYDENDPCHHTSRLKDMLTGVAEHVGGDVTKVHEPKA